MFQASFRGPSDYALVGRLVIIAASVKAILGIYVQGVVAPAMTGGEMMYATNHGDSILFCLAAFILTVNVAEREDRRSAVAAVLFLPLILMGLGANARRTAWVMLAMILAAAYVLGRRRPWKRTLNRFAAGRRAGRGPLRRDWLGADQSRPSPRSRCCAA